MKRDLVGMPKTRKGDKYLVIDTGQKYEVVPVQRNRKRIIKTKKGKVSFTVNTAKRRR